MEPIWAGRAQVGPMLAPWTLLSGLITEKIIKTYPWMKIIELNFIYLPRYMEWDVMKKHRDKWTPCPTPRKPGYVLWRSDAIWRQRSVLVLAAPSHYLNKWSSIYQYLILYGNTRPQWVKKNCMVFYVWTDIFVSFWLVCCSVLYLSSCVRFLFRMFRVLNDEWCQ